MSELTDHELLAAFARSGSETAFAELVARQVNLVYSTALRFSGNPHHAEEITQAVFLILAGKAGKLSPRVVLSGWLYQTARLTAANFVKGEIRRQQREQEAYMQSTLNDTDAAAWEQIAPLLDEAMGRLGETDRAAVVLRFFENKTAAEVAATLQLTEAAAHKRVNRALEKLRKIFSQRGVTLSATLLAGAVSASSVHAAPVGLAATISTVAMAKGAAASGSTLALAKGVLKIMAWMKVKTAVIVTVSLLIVGGTTTTILVSQPPAELLPARPMPNPNGWHDLVTAGGMVSADSGNYPTATRQQLRATAAANAAALTLARAALSNECRVPIEFTTEYIERYLNNLRAIKRLAQAFATEGKWAETENRQHDATQAYLDVIRLGVQSGQGAVLIGELVDIAVEKMGLDQLRPLANKLDATASREVARSLLVLNAQRQTWDECLRLEKNWSRRTYTGLRYEYLRRMTRKSMEPAVQKAGQKNQQCQTELQSLAIRFATRAYELDKGRPPTTPADLVPEYLEAIPVNH